VDLVAALTSKTLAFIELTKPRQAALLMLTMYGAYIATGAPLDPLMLVKLSILGFTGIGGVTALNMYFDYDLDSMMRRTSRRPLPSGRLSLGESLFGVTLMLVLAVFVASTVNEYVLFAILAGLYFDIIGYTELTKRFTALNIVVGSIAGSMPALGGWAAGAGAITLPGVLLALVVYAWQPLHVWFLAYFLEEDYRRANVPMAPFNYNARVFSALTIAHLAIMALSVWLFAYITSRGYVAALISTLFILLASIRVAYFVGSPSKAEALRIFKFATPTLAIVFVLVPLEVLASEIPLPW
jgi:protoheme IX farnesyltransferase